MTWKHTGWLLQWGPPGVTPRVVREVPPRVTLSFHFPPGTPLWGSVKGEIFLRGRWTTRVGGSRVGRWSTRTTRVVHPGRWATLGVVSPAGVAHQVRAVAEVYRPAGFDFARWKFSLRGGFLPRWVTLVDPEGHLRRPRYA